MYDPLPALSPIDFPSDPAPPSDPVATVSGTTSLVGYGIWTWEVAVSVWNLVEDRSKPGHHPGRGPTEPGRYHGQTIRWASIRLEEAGERE